MFESHFRLFFLRDILIVLFFIRRFGLVDDRVELLHLRKVVELGRRRLAPFLPGFGVCLPSLVCLKERLCVLFREQHAADLRFQFPPPLFGLEFEPEHRIAGRRRHEIRILIGVGALFRNAVDIVAAAELFDRGRLSFKNLPLHRVARLFGPVRVDPNPEPVRVFPIQGIPLPDDPSFALPHIGRPPRRIEVMQGDEPRLDVHPRAHLRRRPDQDADISRLHPVEKRLLRVGGLVIMDELHFRFRNPHIGQHLFEIVVD